MELNNLFIYIDLYAVCKNTYLEKRVSYKPYILLEKHTRKLKWGNDGERRSKKLTLDYKDVHMMN